MRVAAYDPFIPADQIARLGYTAAATVEDLLQTSDVVSLHIPATTDTYRIMNAERIALMKSGAYLVNTALGSLIDEAALLAALESGHLRGAGLDVFDPEPPDADNPLLHRPDVIATPHIGGVTVASKARLWSEAIVQSLQVLRGERPPNLCNPDVWPKIVAG
jgi:D-3-phosphoglycerate dehydrogenase